MGGDGGFRDGLLARLGAGESDGRGEEGELLREGGEGEEEGEDCKFGGMPSRRRLPTCPTKLRSGNQSPRRAEARRQARRPDPTELSQAVNYLVTDSHDRSSRMGSTPRSTSG